MCNENPVWLVGIVMTIGAFVVYSIVFGLMFSIFKLSGIDSESGLRVVHAPIFATIPAGGLGLIYFVGVGLKFIKSRNGKRSS